MTVVHTLATPERSPGYARLDHYGEWLLASRQATGAQVSVRTSHGAGISLAVGTTIGSEAMQSTHLYPAYCLSKVLLPVMAGHLVEAGFTLDTPVLVAAASANIAVDAGTTLADLLLHRAGLHQPRAAIWRMCPRYERRNLLLASLPLGRPAYSEIASGLVLEALVEQVFGEPAADWVAGRILDPLGIADEFLVRPSDACASKSRVRPAVGGLPNNVVPLLSELLPSHLAEVRPAFSAFVTADAVSEVLSAVLRVDAGERVDGLPGPGAFSSIMALEGHEHDDPVLGRAARFRGGFFANLGAHVGSTSLSSGSIGVLGGMNNAIAIADPVADMVAVLVTNGVISDDGGMLEVRRRFVEAASAVRAAL